MNIHVAYCIVIVMAFIIGWILGKVDRFYNTDGHVRIDYDWNSHQDYLIYSPDCSIEDMKKKQYLLFSVYDYSDRHY